MKDFNQLKKNFKKDFSDLKKVRIAILGDSATQFLVQAIKGQGYEDGVNYEIFEAIPAALGMRLLQLCRVYF